MCNASYLIWDDARSGKPDIFYRKRTASNGTWVSPDVKVSDEAGGGGGSIQRNPRIAGTAAGAQSAVWVDFRASQKNIYSSQLAAGSSTWATNKKVTDNTAADKDFPDVAVGSDGTAYAVWQDSRNGNPDIYFAKLPPGASTWTTTANVKVSDDPGTAAQTNPRIGIDATGNLIVVWLDARTTPAQIRMSRVAAGFSTWSASSVVSDAAARPLSTALAVRADGKASLAFHDNRSGNNDVYTSEYDPWSSSWTVTTIASDDPGSAAQQSPTISYGTAELALAWRDDRSGNADVRARRATLTGTDHFAMSYDGLERLTALSVTNPESFVLDAASNIASRTGPSANNTYDTANRQTSDGSQSYVWSQSDRLTSRGADTFGYDALDRLKTSTVGGTARTYTYNGDGLVQSRTQGVTTSFLWDAVISPSRLLQVGGDRIIYGLGPIYAVKVDTSTVTFARDGGTSIRAELNAAGSVTGSFRYRAYGQIAQWSGSSTPGYLGYVGQLLDPTGLYYMRARWHDPISGRFMSRDPVGGDTNAPASLNAYAYAHANPSRLSDPSGTCPICLAIVGAVDAVLTGGLIARTAISLSGNVRQIEGVTVVENVHGPAKDVLNLFGAPAMTLGSDFVFSSTTLTYDNGELNPIGRHEIRGHVPQAKELGPLFAPEYMLDWVAAYLVMDELDKHGFSITLHDAHPMEVDAQVRAGLPAAPSLKRKWTALWRALALACAIAVAACIFPVDKTKPIVFINQTGQQVVVFEFGRRYPSARHEVAAGARYRSVWLDPELDPADERVKFRVEATDAAGALIFCHDYTMNEFTQAKWVLVITERNDCPPE